MVRAFLATLCLLALSVAACGGASSDTTVPALLPDAAAAEFALGPGNDYWPLAPGSRWVYEGMDAGDFEHIEVTVEAGTRSVMGVAAVVIHDVVSDASGVIEDTYDWYLQDRAGNVWYVGEDSKEIEDDRVVSTAGSWEAGVDGAQPGIIMWADPAEHVGIAYFQEYYPSEAEDKAEILRLGDTVTVSAGTFDDVLVVREWNPLEPGVTELKYFAPGVGLILEETESGDEARIELVHYSIAG